MIGQMDQMAKEEVLKRLIEAMDKLDAGRMGKSVEVDISAAPHDMSDKTDMTDKPADGEEKPDMHEDKLAELSGKPEDDMSEMKEIKAEGPHESSPVDGDESPEMLEKLKQLYSSLK